MAGSPPQNEDVHAAGVRSERLAFPKLQYTRSIVVRSKAGEVAAAFQALPARLATP